MPSHLLAFSHGRAALAWLIRRRGPFASALVCAYTCPELPRLLSASGLRLGFYDWDAVELDALVQALPTPCLVPDAAARDRLLAASHGESLLTRPVWTPMHRLPMYRDCPKAPLPVAEAIADRLVSLPSSAVLAEGLR
jgi:hypothetical protein